jgi:DNA polymerase-3 subunit gamma/tau
MATYQSLYRRYRSQRFDEVLGQDHVTRALRNAVRDGRVGHAYLFSGPRGTGKTSTARILAKVLNCAAPEDGEPCGKCEGCVAVAEGRVVDWLLEQDAASKSKVDDMRDLLERVPLGTSGNRKVIILDEVHMLSQGAENALLKTLEEPPAHVVFILATTDPQKVRPTILSRTQHFEFHLLPPDLLGDHVRRIIADAGLGIDAASVDAAVDHVLRAGQGSARDTLSALDQVAALGEVVDEAQPVDAVLDAVCDRDAGRVLLAVADALAAGRDPRTLGEALIGALRDAFLALMGAADEHLAPGQRERAARVGAALGAAGLTRALDVLGEALTELSRKPDPRIVVEVALIRITQPAADRTLGAVLERLDRLERGAPPAAPAAAAAGTAAVPPGGAEHGAAAAREVLSSSRRREPEPPAADKGSAPTLGAVSRRRGGRSATPPTAEGALPAAGDADQALPGAPAVRATAALPQPEADWSPPATAVAVPSGSAAPEPDRSPPAPAVAVPPGSAAPEPARSAPGPAVAVPSGSAAPEPARSLPGPAMAAPPGSAAAPQPGGALPAIRELDAAWTGSVLAELPVKFRSKWRGGRWVEPGDGRVRFAVPNTWHQKECEKSRRDIEQALAAHFGRPVAVAVVVEGGAPAGPQPGAPPPPEPDDEHIDPAELRDAADADVATNGVDLLLREFGGGQLVEEEP